MGMGWECGEQMWDNLSLEDRYRWGFGGFFLGWLVYRTVLCCLRGWASGRVWFSAVCWFEVGLGTSISRGFVAGYCL